MATPRCGRRRKVSCGKGAATAATTSDTSATRLSPRSELGDRSSPSDEGKLPREEVNVLDSPPTGISSFLLVFAIL